jgi:Ni/Co efflux regulator RcnB
MTTPTTTTNPANAFLRSHSFALVMAVAALTCSSSFAEKPEWAGGGKNKGNKHDQTEQSDHGNSGTARKPRKTSSRPRSRSAATLCRSSVWWSRTTTASSSSRAIARPGLAKKNNGCLPPGQAKKYAIGQPLPRDVVFYPVPSSVVVQLGAPPAGHKYVRVATDILLIAVGTSMVVDAIQDLAAI